MKPPLSRFEALIVLLVRLPALNSASPNPSSGRGLHQGAPPLHAAASTPPAGSASFASPARRQQCVVDDDQAPWLPLGVVRTWAWAWAWAYTHTTVWAYTHTTHARTHAHTHIHIYTHTHQLHQVSERQGKRPYMEDKTLIESDWHHKGWHLFGIFDG